MYILYFHLGHILGLFLPDYVAYYTIHPIFMENVPYFWPKLSLLRCKLPICKIKSKLYRRTKEPKSSNLPKVNTCNRQILPYALKYIKLSISEYFSQTKKNSPKVGEILQGGPLIPDYYMWCFCIIFTWQLSITPFSYPAHIILSVMRNWAPSHSRRRHVDNPTTGTNAWCKSRFLWAETYNCVTLNQYFRLLAVSGVKPGCWKIRWKCVERSRAGDKTIRLSEWEDFFSNMDKVSNKVHGCL